MSNQFQLMREQRFRPFFFTQFLGAFNDNVFKTALITLVTFRAGQLTTLDGKIKARLAGKGGDIREPAWGPFQN
mgnify:CR=1 FL=1